MKAEVIPFPKKKELEPSGIIAFREEPPKEFLYRLKQVLFESANQPKGKCEVIVLDFSSCVDSPESREGVDLSPAVESNLNESN